MVLIPAGEFQMGESETLMEETFRTVYVDAFYIDKYEVTNTQYRQFVEATGHSEPESYSYIKRLSGIKPWSDRDFNDDDQPVVCVNWEDAAAYCQWAGKRLPTEVEWEKAARGGLVGKKYVWGDSWPPPRGAGNFADESPKKVFPNSWSDWLFIEGYYDGYAYTAPVGSFAPNGYGLYDMAGNVWEWCNSSYYTNPLKHNPTDPDSDPSCVVCSSTWDSYDPWFIRVASRINCLPSSSSSGGGFRCARDAKP